MIKGIEVGCLVNSPIKDRECGRQILEVLADQAPAYLPQRYNNYEPIKKTFEPNNLDKALELWETPFLWRRTRPRLLGDAGFGYKGTHDSISLSMSLKAFDLSQTLALFEAIDAQFGIVLARVHVPTDADYDNYEYYDQYVRPFEFLTTHDLREGLPGLSWAMMFGQPYRELFGDRLFDVPAFSVQQLGSAVYVQLTESMTDPGRQRDAYLAAQAAAQQHLDSDAFRGKASGKCRVPTFRVPRP